MILLGSWQDCQPGKHFKTAENFAERSKTNVFIWEKISRVFFLPACSAILDCSKCHASRAESAIYTSYIYECDVLYLNFWRWDTISHFDQFDDISYMGWTYVILRAVRCAQIVTGVSCKSSELN